MIATPPPFPRGAGQQPLFYWTSPQVWKLLSLVHELGLKNGYLVPTGWQSITKYDKLSKSVALGQKLRYFTDQNQPRGEPHENGLWEFRNECYKQTGRSRWKNGVICLVSVLTSWAMVLKLSKKVNFLQLYWPQQET